MDFRAWTNMTWASRTAPVIDCGHSVILIFLPLNLDVKNNYRPKSENIWLHGQIVLHHWRNIHDGLPHFGDAKSNYCQVSNIRGTLVGNKIVDHSDHYIFILDLTPGLLHWTKTTARWDGKRLSLGIRYGLY